MRISSVNAFNKMSFGENLLTKQTVQTQSSPVSSNDKNLKMALLGFATLGTAVVVSTLLKKKGINPLNTAKTATDNIKKSYQSSKREMTIDKVLGNRRDAEAMKIYKSYMARTKMASLEKKFLDGQFDGKSRLVFEHIRRNQAKLRRMAEFGV